MANSQAPAHWSKDFVEHLRTVHFALIATSAALLIVALTSKPYSMEVAKSELRRLLQLQSHWSDKERPVYGNSLPLKSNKSRKELLDSLGDKFNVQLTELENVTSKPIKIGENCCLVIDDELDVKQRSSGINVLAKMPSNMVFLNSKVGPTIKTLPDAIPEFSNSLSDLRRFWNTLEELHPRFYFPDSLDPIGVITDSEGNFKGKIEVRPSKNTLEAFLYGDIAEKHPVSFELAETYGHKDEFTLEFKGEYRSDKKQPLIFHLLVRDIYYTDFDGGFLADYLHLKSRDFETALYDLLQVADKNGIEDFKDLKEVLATTEVSEAPVFEAFGIKFPADIAALGGAIVMLSTQLYFFIYLRKLCVNLSADDPGWEVPWMGMDSSRLARMVLFVTVIVLPVLSLAVLDGEWAIRATRGDWKIVGYHVQFTNWRTLATSHFLGHEHHELAVIVV
jgi:hypothetical protein